jgi:hypothetical protein
MADPRRDFIEHFFGVVESGDAAARGRRIDDAVEMYDLAATLSPGHGLPFTRKAMLLFRAAFGAPVAPREEADERPAISMSALGQYGQFGNQLLQYAFLRLYAQEHGLNRSCRASMRPCSMSHPTILRHGRAFHGFLRWAPRTSVCRSRARNSFSTTMC